MATVQAERLSAETWGCTLSGAPVIDRRVSDLVPVHVRRWQDIEPKIEQAALDQHFVSLHLGGDKQLIRQGEGARLTREAPSGAHSVVPAGAAFRWDTQGPVDFAHIYFDPAVLDRIIAETFDRDPARVALHESLAVTDDLVRSLAVSLLDELEQDDPQSAYVDEVLHLLLCRLLRLHSDARSSGQYARYMLAPVRLKRALEFIDDNLGAAIGVPEIAIASGVSPYHFSRAFRQATGRPPYAYLLERRMEKAKTILCGSGIALSSVAQQCGFASLSQFSRMFRREVGVTPTHFRNQRCL